MPMRWLRLPWQPRRNRLPANVQTSPAQHDGHNLHGALPPLSERAKEAAKFWQSISDPQISVLMARQIRPQVPKANQLTPELLVAADRWLRQPPPADSPNLRETFRQLVLEHPEIDEKSGSLRFAIEPNKLHRQTDSVDPQLERHFEFTRYLVQQGTFNEGFEADAAPQQYRQSFTDDDLRQKDN